MIIIKLAAALVEALIRYLMMGLLDLEKVISLTGFKSQVLHNLNIFQT